MLIEQCSDRWEIPILLTFLIKSIMNKKLFSWKALAGLALLVAMGLTSCKQGTEVDPTDPYSTKTPTNPSITTKGTADVTITITKAGDLATQWAALDSKTKEALREKTTLNVAINNAGYKLEGAVIALPNFFSGADNGATGKIVNVTFNNGFTNAGYNLTANEYPLTGAGDLNAAKKQFLWLNTDNLAGNQVNFFFPAGDFDLTLAATKTQTSLNSEAGANIGILNASAGAQKSALSINSGIAVKGINLIAGDAVLAGGSIDAKLAGAAEPFAWSASGSPLGFAVGTTDLIYVKSLIVDYGTTSAAWGFDNYSGASVNTITIKKSGTINLTGWQPVVGKIVGENANAKVNIAGSTSWQGDGNYSDAMNAIGSFEKVVLTTNNTIRLADASKYTSVQFKDAVKLVATSLSGLTFNILAIPVTADNLTFNFNKVTFRAIPTLTAAYSTVTSSTTATYQWIVDGTGAGYWQKVTSAAPLTAINANAVVQEFDSGAVNVNAAGALIGWNTGAVTSTVIKITTVTTDNIWPEGTIVSLNSCKYYDGANTVNVQIAQANTLFGNVSQKTAWYDVVLDGTTLKWRLNSADNWVLVNP